MKRDADRIREWRRRSVEASQERARAEHDYPVRRIGRNAGPKRQSFSRKYDGTGPRYGTLFVAVRREPCWLMTEGYRGPGHKACGLGSQGGHTAHHIAFYDDEGMLPGCGLAHDLYAGYGGRKRMRAFREWLMGKGFRLEEVALGFVERAKEALG